MAEYTWLHFWDALACEIAYVLRDNNPQQLGRKYLAV